MLSSIVYLWFKITCQFVTMALDLLKLSFIYHDWFDSAPYCYISIIVYWHFYHSGTVKCPCGIFVIALFFNINFW